MIAISLLTTCICCAGERPFECSVCHSRFTLKHSMMRHRRKHDGHGGGVSGTAADVGDAQSDSDAESLPNTSQLLVIFSFFFCVLLCI